MSISASLADPFPKKPKAMHWKIYDWLRLVSERCADASLMAAARRLGLFKGELDDVLE